MRNVPKARAERNVRNRPVSVVVEQITGAAQNPLAVDVLPNRATRLGKQFVHVAFRAMKFSREYCRGKIRIVAVAVDVIQHHRQQHGSIHPLGRPFREDTRRMRYQIDNVRPAEGGNVRRRLCAEAEVGIACERPGEGATSFCRGQGQPRPLVKIAWQQVPRYGKAKQLKVATICDFERLGGVRDGKISRTADLLVTTLGVAAHPVELKIDKAQVVAPARHMRTQTEKPVYGCSDAGNLDRSGVSPGYSSLERMFGDLARFQLDESGREIVGDRKS